MNLNKFKTTSTMKKLLAILTVTTVITFVACKKEKDTESPVVTITSPTQSETFTAGDSILIAFTATDIDMHAYEFTVINTANDSVLFEGGEHTHGNATFSQKFKSPASATEMKLTVTAEDHNGNGVSSFVSFESN